MVTEAMVAKSGGYVVSSGLFMELVIFHDSTYMYLAIMGAILSMFGVFHELQTSKVEKEKNHTGRELFAEMLKGFLLGFVAIPFWYLILVSMGDSILDAVASNVFGRDINHEDGIDNSVWMLLSIPLAWYTVPILDCLTRKASWLFNVRKKDV